MTQETYAPIYKRSRDFLDRLPSAKLVKMTDATSAGLGLYDQVGLYPHLIAEWGSSRIAVPLGTQDDALWDAYEVAPFTFQQIPQPEYELGWSIPIIQVNLLKADPCASNPELGVVQVQADGSLRLHCFSYRGFTEWVTIPGCKSRMRPWTYYKAWEIVVADGKHTRVAVRYDADQERYEHWPEDELCA